MSDTTTGWCKLFHPRGPQVTLVVPSDPVEAFAWVGAALDAGWLVQAPGLEEGESRELIGSCVKGYTKEGSPLVDLYSHDEGQNRYKFLTVYLDDDEKIAAFEYASGLRFASMPEYVGVGHLERGNAKTDRLFSTPPRPFNVVWKKNPKYQEYSGDDKSDPRTPAQKTKKRFVRWVDQAPKPQADEHAPPPPSDRQALQRDIADLLAAQGKTLKGLMTWLKVPDPEGTGLGDLTEQQLQAARAKLREKSKGAA